MWKCNRNRTEWRDDLLLRTLQPNWPQNYCLHSAWGWSRSLRASQNNNELVWETTEGPTQSSTYIQLPIALLPSLSFNYCQLAESMHTQYPVCRQKKRDKHTPATRQEGRTNWYCYWWIAYRVPRCSEEIFHIFHLSLSLCLPEPGPGKQLKLKFNLFQIKKCWIEPGYMI